MNSCLSSSGLVVFWEKQAESGLFYIVKLIKDIVFKKKIVQLLRLLLTNIIIQRIEQCSVPSCTFHLT